MNVEVFINKLVDIARNVPTVYALGTYGQTLTTKLIDSNKNRLSWYTASRIKLLNENLGKTAFDCSGLIKGVLKFNFPNTKYDAKFDFNADALIKACENVSSDFTNITRGELVYLKSGNSSHIGVYIGDGYVVECTPKWNNGVQIVELSARNWHKHGKLTCWIDYNEPKEETPTICENRYKVCTISSNLNVRKGAGVRYSCLGQFAKNTIVNVLNKDNASWYFCKGIDTKGRTITGYCFAKYLKGVK